jgi:hypothetical protein
MLSDAFSEDLFWQETKNERRTTKEKKVFIFSFKGKENLDFSFMFL